MDTMFSQKVAQDPRLHFRGKKLSKNQLHGFFLKRFFEKNAIFDCFFCIRYPISQNRDQIQTPWFRNLHKHFIGNILT